MLQTWLPILVIVQSLYSSICWSSSHHPQTFLNAIKGSKTEGQQIVQHFCINCHAEKPLIPLGAPRIGNPADWKTRQQQGMKRLFQHTNEGLRAMPPRGGCFECTDQQLMLAILALLPNKKDND